MTDYWLSDLDTAFHLMGIAGMALIVFSMVYFLRKRKWLVRQGRMRTWLSLHHWAGFIGGAMALVHTLGNLNGLGSILLAMLLLVLGTSGIYWFECRARRPLNEALADLASLKQERSRLDAAYKGLHAGGRSGTPEGHSVYRDLMGVHGRVVDREREVAQIREHGTGWTWWRHPHNVGTMMLVGVLLVHIWSKLYFGGGL